MVNVNLKRLIDMALSFLFIVLTLPFFILLPILIRMESKGSVIFKQQRIGKNEQPFFIYKFRSMHVNNVDPFEYDRMKNNYPLETRVGAFMRRTKLDEIPQFINVLRGDMSLIGPRPCLAEHMKWLGKNERRRFDCLPGMTGLAEIKGLDMDRWNERLPLDLWYVRHQSLKLDFMIMIKTVRILLQGIMK